MSTRPNQPKARRVKAAKKRMVARAKPKRTPMKKAPRKVKQPAASVETVAVEVIEQPAPGVINGTEVEETPSSGLGRALKRMNPNR
jgi:hypothetical protein